METKVIEVLVAEGDDPQGVLIQMALTRNDWKKLRKTDEWRFVECFPGELEKETNSICNSRKGDKEEYC